MKSIKILLIALIASFSIVACDSGDGEAEKLGEKMDNAVQDTRDGLEDAADEIGDKAEDLCEEATDENC